MKVSLLMEGHEGEGLKTLLQINFPSYEIHTLKLSTWVEDREFILNSSLVIIDSSLDTRISELSMVEKIAKLSNNVLLLSEKNEEEVILDYFYLGVKGVLLKNNQVTTLLDAISYVIQGEIYVDQRINRHIIANLFKKEKQQVKSTQSIRPQDLLTKREWEILEAMALDISNKEIAKTLYVSEPTIHNYSASIQKKLNVNSRVGAVVKSIKEGWINAY
ncbi:response regulator transcription factor [Bacillus sp. RO1]|uniref:response regulator transcription factor n=1 Tax=Bacillus sp. RO1 TaxID=2722703 RepID=UPI0014564341|nr:response regulator transcription factor [Bacillus sp. RO1]NLP52089.1 response regulator transcription factor [Bacillus sp. RO1]